MKAKPNEPKGGTDAGTHWRDVYERMGATEVSWYQERPTRSLNWITEVAPPRTDPRIIDVGAGASTLVDHLLSQGYTRITVLDLAEAALEVSRARLGDSARRVEWIAGDLRDFTSASPFDVWHDRAVLHFLTSEADRRRYAEVVRSVLRTGGHAIIATFAPGGPTRCSGLETEQYDAARIRDLMGAEFGLVGEEQETHRTPSGDDQLFSWFLLRKRG